MKDLEHYFRENVANGIIDFRIRAEVHQDGRTTFYIHPLGKDGETLDFSVSANTLHPACDPGGNLYVHNEGREALKPSA